MSQVTDGMPLLAAGNTVQTLAPKDVYVAAAEKVAAIENVIATTTGQMQWQGIDEVRGEATLPIHPEPYFPPTPIAPAYEKYVPIKDELSDPATKTDLSDLKDQINDSFNEIANLILDLTQRLDLLDGRIDRYNAKSSHKL